MRTLDKTELTVSGGEIVPGFPSEHMPCVNTKLMIIAHRQEAGFDISEASHALLRVCAEDFFDFEVANEWVRTGAIPV